MSSKLKKVLTAMALVLFALVNVGHFGVEGELKTDTYTVKAGDNFWYITENYREKDARNLYIFEYQDEVRELNPWLKESHNQLKVGDVITLQYMEKAQ